MKKIKDLYEEHYNGSKDFKTYKEVISIFNKKVFQLMIEKNEALPLGAFLGSISIIESPVKIKTGKNNGNINTMIDWKLSNEKKRKLLSEGKTPLKKEKVEGKIIGDNGGEEWLIYKIVDSIAKYHWRRHRRVIKGEQNHPLYKTTEYKFIPSRNNIRTMSSYRTENEILYK